MNIEPETGATGDQNYECNDYGNLVLPDSADEIFGA